MLFKVVDKANWKDNVWDRLFNLVNDFKNEYNIKVTSIGYAGGNSNKIYFDVNGYDIHFEPNSQGFWITFESNTSKADFDEKYEFIFSRIK